MEENTNGMSRSERRQNGRKRRRRRGCLRILGILLLILLGVFLYAYYELRQTTDTIHTDIEEDRITHTSRETDQVDLDGDAFSILLLGIDTDDNRSGQSSDRMQGRSDTIMVMTVNPEEQKTTLVSIPRDTYTEIIGRGNMDKINHAYAYGRAAMSINTVQNLLDIPIDYFVSVNMEGLQQIIDAVGGITLTPSMSFTQSGYSFVEGQPTQMDGAQALAYSRMRYKDPQGDYGRQGRQREVVLTTLNKVASFNSILNYQSVLNTMEDNVMTNLTFDEMVSMFLNYRSALTNIEQLQLSGYGTTMNGIYYEIIPDEELHAVSQQLKSELGIED
ncbi:MAG TPA: LCP family protein [Atopostipes sp.]|nr:LCP family protein [Atopostipes sp.]